MQADVSIPITKCLFFPCGERIKACPVLDTGVRGDTRTLNAASIVKTNISSPLEGRGSR